MTKTPGIKSTCISCLLIGLLLPQACWSETADSASDLWMQSDMFLAKKASLKTCRKLKSKLDKYTELRRRGGSAAKMDGWKRARKDAAEAFRKQRCHKWSKKRLD